MIGLCPCVRTVYNKGNTEDGMEGSMSERAKTGLTKWEVYPLGDQAIGIRAEESDDPAMLPAVIRKARVIHDRLASRKLPAVREIVPALVSIAIYYDSLVCSYELMDRQLNELVNDAQDDVEQACAGRQFEVPVCYGGEFGPDLGDAAARAGLTEEEVVRLHAGTEYTVGMIGFVPGFPYLAGLPPQLHMPRRQEPRTSVPAGSVGIGGMLTGIYPAAIPGGWQLIGRTPLRLFDPAANPPSLLAPGDAVSLIPIDAETFANMERENR